MAGIIEDRRKLAGKLLPADVLLVSEKGLKHLINRTLGRSRWHHVMLCIGKSRVLEATPKKGCHISKLDLTRDCYIAYKAIRHRKLSEEVKKEMVKKAVRLFMGKKFGWRQLAKVFLRRILEVRGNGDKACRPGYRCDTNGITCSNLVAMNYHMAGCIISGRWAPEYVMPRDYDKMEEFAVVFERHSKNKKTGRNKKEEK